VYVATTRKAWWVTVDRMTGGTTRWLDGPVVVVHDRLCCLSLDEFATDDVCTDFLSVG